MVHLHFVSSFMVALGVFSGPMFTVSVTWRTHSWVEGSFKADACETFRFQPENSMSHLRSPQVSSPKKMKIP